MRRGRVEGGEVVSRRESPRGLLAEELSLAEPEMDLARAALLIANDRLIDLAILDWNLGAGNDGLQLLEGLYLFNPDVVAIMITGYAHQATPLAAMRMGVRDYLDKNQDLDRDTFLAAVRRFEPSARIAASTPCIKARRSSGSFGK